MNFISLGLSICSGENPSFLWLFDLTTPPSLLYYSYIPIIVASLLVALYVFSKDKKSLKSRLLLTFTIFFVLWVINILVQWVASYHIVLMFAWQLTAIFEVGMFLSAIYFVQVFLYNKDISFVEKIIMFIIAIATLVTIPTTFNVVAYDIQNCEGMNGLLWNIIYTLEPAAIVLIVWRGLRAHYLEKDPARRKQITIFTTGIAISLTAFFLSNFYGEITRFYEFNLWGPIGMVIFLVLLAYLIVRYKAFNVKIFATQALVAGIAVLIGARLFYSTTTSGFILSAATLIAFLVSGFFLIKSVKGEIIEREEIEKLAGNLEKANEQVYKHGLELAVKNKTLSLLAKLYDISIQSLAPQELAEKITQTIQTEFEFERVGIALYDAEGDTLSSLASAESKRFHEAHGITGNSFFAERIVPAAQDAFFSKAVTKRTMAYQEIESGDHVRSFLVYPLIVDDHVIGIFSLALNRILADLIDYEKQSIASFVNVIAIALDRARLDEELRKANEQLSEFMSLATHEIRNPATFIKGFAAGALEGDLGELSLPVKDGMQKMYVRAGDIIHLGNQYLNKSKLELNKMTYEFTPLDLGKLAGDLVHEFEPAAIQQGIAITAVIDTNQTYTVSADSGKIKEVIGNLIDNAIKYTKQGSVTVSVVKNEKAITVKITDTGVGIPAETIPQLFKKFSRADAEKANILGTGLGLYLAKIFIDAHHGKIWVESEGKDKGSTFYIELPSAA